MKILPVIFLIIFSSLTFAQEPKFKMDLPPVAAVNRLTADMFKGSDAIILWKEQDYTEQRYNDDELYTPQMVWKKIVVAKVFNDAAVSHFGSFEYEFPYYRDSKFEERVKVQARIMKPDSTIWVLPDSAITFVTGDATSSGKPLTKKIIFKLANLSPGDIVQIETMDVVPYSFLRQVLFFYHDSYPVLTSKVYIDLASKEKLECLSIPADKVGEPEIKEFHVGKSRSWTVKNLAQIPQEAFGRPFADVSYFTAIVDPPDKFDKNGWQTIAKGYLKYYIDKGSVSKSFMREIGLDPSLSEPSWANIEQAYTALCKYFKLYKKNSVYTSSENIDDVIKNKEADATDLAYIMFKILDRWNVTVTPVLIRDRRQGIYEKSVSSLVWFNRLGLLVSSQGTDRVYDFDRSIPSKYEFPWYLNGTTLLALNDSGVTHIPIQLSRNIRSYISTEYHTIQLKQNKRPTDSVFFILKGSIAQRLRGELYPLKGKDLTDYVRSYIRRYALQDADTIKTNDFLNTSEVRLMGTGTSQSSSLEIDSFLTFQPRNHLLREFRNKFTSKTRYDDIFLDEPFIYSFQWSVKAPEGYFLSQLPQSSSLEGIPGTTAQITYFQKDDASCTLNVSVVFNTDFIHKEKYNDWLAFLDNAIKSMEHEISFKKK